MQAITKMVPKVFISYSWTTHAHQELVRQWAERLIADGVDVVLDIFELKEGNDKYAFMERMVTDPSVSHVLVICDRVYAEKADARQAGVGTESQIISREVYDKVEQSKFIPIACETDDKGNWYLPTFLKSRIGIDFSTPEAVNENWERLVRLLHGKPQHAKPSLGTPPSYLNASPTSASPAIGKFATLRQSILQAKPTASLDRADFLDACFQHADTLRTRAQPQTDDLGDQAVDVCGKLKVVRNQIVDWILLEAPINQSTQFQEAIGTPEQPFPRADRRLVSW